MPSITERVTRTLERSLVDRLLPPNLELLPQVNEAYELELACYESDLLSETELIARGAYFARVNDTFTRHYLMCSGEPVKLPKHSSSRLRSFFQTNQFKTGYATHGLFPYRGKFHPQMIHGLINVMGLQPGELLLDPMMGSGTALIEATLMGIRSVGYDASPFCVFMTRAKLSGVVVDLAPLKEALARSRDVYEAFSRQLSLDRTSVSRQEPLFLPASSNELAIGGDGNLGCLSDPIAYAFLELAFLDGVGYAARSSRKSPFDQFHHILERYVFVAEKIQTVLSGMESELAEAQADLGDARKLPLAASSVDGIIFSPPYSFAIDYLENDAPHLESLGVDVAELRESMVGLRGRNAAAKYEHYVSDMEAVMAECARVLSPGRFCTVIVGTNNNQLARILDIPADQVEGIDELLVRLGEPYRLNLRRKIARQITGMANTMRHEFILILQKV